MAAPLSPNMSLPIAPVGVEPGPTYAFDTNTSLTLIDQHDHSPGKGVQITPSGLNINSDLDFQDSLALNVAGLNFFAQSGAPGVNTLYESGVDLFFVDGVGNNIRITQSGGIAGTPGSISNLVPPASASYVAGSKTFVWQSGTSLAANMDFASAIFRNISPNSTFGITVQPPAALGSNWTLTLPPIPVATGFMQLDTSGVITAPIPISHGLTDANIAVGTQIPLIIVPINAAYTVLTTDSVILCSTPTAYTVTLYSPVTNSGKLLRIRKTSSNLNAVSITGTGLSTSLNTEDEELVLVNDGTNWIVISRSVPGPWNNFTPTIANFGTATSIAFQWRRAGRDMIIRGAFTAGTPTGSAGTFTCPTGTQIDTTTMGATFLPIGNWASTNTAGAGGFTLYINSPTTVSFGGIPGSGVPCAQQIGASSMGGVGNRVTVGETRFTVNGWHG